MTDAPLIALLEGLVAIDSTSSLTNEPIVDWIAQQLSPLGFSLERQRYTDERGTPKVNLIARRGGAPDQPAGLALVGHTDCVPYDPAWSEALKLSKRDGTLVGRGACDTKGFIAAALTAASRTARLPLARPLYLFFTADEEIGCLGAKQLLSAKLPRIDAAIVGEPTSLAPVRATKGYCLAEAQVLGTEAHSAHPSAGASAIHRASRLIAALEAWSQQEARSSADPSFDPPHTTWNVGTISGGTAKNILAASCRFTLEWRPVPGERLERLPEKLEHLANQLRKDDPGFQLELDVKRMDRGFATPVDHPFIRWMEKASATPAKTAAFGTEGPQLDALGASVAVFGPGDIRNAHKSFEFVRIDELIRCAGILADAIEQRCAGPA